MSDLDHIANVGLKHYRERAEKAEAELAEARVENARLLRTLEKISQDNTVMHKDYRAAYIWMREIAQDAIGGEGDREYWEQYDEMDKIICGR